MVIYAPTVAFIGGGPMALMTALEFVRNAPDRTQRSVNEQLIIISKEPEENLGFGDIMDTVHKEVLFNVAAGKMSLDPDHKKSAEFVHYLEKAGIDQGTFEYIKNLNTSEKLENQFVPRILLQPVAQINSSRLKEEAAAKGIKYEYIQGKATDINDSVADVNERKSRHSRVKIEINLLGDTKEKRVIHRTVDMAVIAFGSPKRVLPGEEALASSPNFSLDLNHPPQGHVLHPENNISKIPMEYHVVIAGSKLSAVDALIVLSKRGYFKEPGHKVTIVSPYGEFPYPHEAIPSNAEEYKSQSLLSDADVPTRLRKPQTAQDLADAIVLTCLYAAGTSYDGKNWTLPPQDEANSKAITRLVENANEISDRMEEVERAFIKQKFAVDRKTYGWQVALDVDFRPKIEEIWKAFNPEQKKLWLQSPEHEKLYNDLRHRIPVKLHELLAYLQQKCKITVKHGRISNIRERNGKIQVFANGNDRTPFVECDQVVKATGWEQRYPIDNVPLLRNMRRHGMLHRDEATDMGVVVSENNTHNIEIIGQLNKMKNYEISGFQQLRTHASEKADQIRKKLQERREFRYRRKVEEP